MPKRLWCAFFLLTAAAAAQPLPDFSELEKVATAELAETNTPGAQVAIVRGDKVVFAKGFGVANVETGAPMSPDLLCRLGSTTKMFTAAALVGLAEEGKLTLDDPIGKHVKGLSPRIAALTAGQLLSHTAGVHDEAPMFGLHDDAALGATLRSWKDDIVFGEPGRYYSYSNPGYHLAGLLIEELSGKPYADAVAERLFGPLGMARTTFRPTVAMTYPLALGHEARGKGAPTVVRPFADNAASWPAGSIFTSAHDFTRFAIAFLNDGKLDGKTVIPPAVIAQLSTPHAKIPGDGDNNYGYGLNIRRYRGVPVVEHGGSRSGYGSFLRMAPRERVAILVMVNKSGGSMNKTVEKACEMMLPLGAAHSPAKREAIAMSAAEMESYAGVYRNAATRAELVVENGKLYLKTGRQVELIKVGEGRLAPNVSGVPPQADVIVLPGANHKAEYLYGGGRMARRVPAGTR